MAGAGYKQFADGDVLTAAQVQTFLQDQAVMRFADSSARDAALGTAVAEGMVAYLDDTNTPQYYDGSSWTDFTPSSLDASVITSGTFDAARIPGLDGSKIVSGKIDQARLPMKKIARFTGSGSWTVPAGVTYAIAHMLGGGGGGGSTAGAGGAGGQSSVALTGGTVTAGGGTGGSASVGGLNTSDSSPGGANSGRGTRIAEAIRCNAGEDAQWITAGNSVTPGASISVTVGAGGNTPGISGRNGGSGYVYIEYYE